MATTNNPPRTTVAPEVASVIYHTMLHFGRPDRDYTENQILNGAQLTIEGNLGIPAGVHELLATPYSKISRDIHHGTRIFRSEAKAAATVKDSIDLVHKKANEK